MVTQSPTAGGAGGVVTDGEVRANQAPVTPEVPHLLAPDPVCNVRGDLSNSPLHSALRFNHFTPNPSAPSQPSASPPPLHVHGGMSACAAVVFCCVCGLECGPDMQFGKCGSCLDAAFHAYAALHVPELVPHSRNSSASASSDGPRSAKRARRLSPPHRKAGPPI